MKRNVCFILLFLLAIKGYSQGGNPSSTFIVDSMYSQPLNEIREFCLYLPSGYKPGEQIPLILATDGQIIVEGQYRQILDSLITNKVIVPVALVAPFSNEKEAGEYDTYRQYEYIKGYRKNDTVTESRFADHYKFFTEEIPDYIRSKYQLETDRHNTTFYGFSNGGGFGISLLTLTPGFCRNYLCFSPLGYDRDIVTGKKENIDEKLYIAYGKNEYQALIEKFNELLEDLDNAGYPYELTIFDGGHDRKWWEYYFKEYITGIYRLH